MYITLTDGSIVKVIGSGKFSKGENEKIHCSMKCPFLQTLEWEPENPMDRGIPTPRCGRTGHDFGWKSWMGYFDTVRTEECASKDPDPEVSERRVKYVEEHGEGEKYPMPSNYTLAKIT